MSQQALQNKGQGDTVYSKISNHVIHAKSKATQNREGAVESNTLLCWAITMCLMPHRVLRQPSGSPGREARHSSLVTWLSWAKSFAQGHTGRRGQSRDQVPVSIHGTSTDYTTLAGSMIVFYELKKKLHFLGLRDLDQGSTIFFYKGLGSKHFRLMSHSFCYNHTALPWQCKAAINNTQTNGNGCVLIKLYLQK